MFFYTVAMHRPSELTILDRLEYGAIAAFFGLLVGGLLALFVWWMMCGLIHACQPYNTKLVEFSVAYYFFVGIVEGVDAAEVIAIGLIAGVGSTLAVIVAEAGGRRLCRRICARRAFCVAT